MSDEPGISERGVDQAKLIELVTEEERSIEISRERDRRVFTVIERKLGIAVHRPEHLHSCVERN